MNEGWESPDESGQTVVVQSQQFENRRRSNYNQNQNWRSKRDDYAPNITADSSWGEMRPSKPYRQNRDHSRGRQNRDRSHGRQSRDKYQYNEGLPVVLQVPTTMVGKIIGRGGSKITDLQRISGAKIYIDTKNQTDITEVKLFGEQASMDDARKMILDLIEVKPLPHKSAFQESNGNEKQFQAVKFNWKELSEECDRLTKEKWSKCPDLKKDFYTENPAVSAMTEDEVRKFRWENNNIVVSRVFAEEAYELGKEPGIVKPCPKPVRSFLEAFSQWPEMLEEIRKAGFERPSPIQCQMWPALLAGEDVIGIAQTGTGKTLAFLLPALIHIAHQPKQEGHTALVLAPTRELALQIEREVAKYSYKGIRAVCLYGGGNRREQINTLDMEGVQVIIATPGRLNDLVAAGHMDVSRVSYLVLDEADRMLDMGFEPQIRKVLLDIRPDRQTVMTSATWPPGVRRLAHSYMSDPLQVYIGSLDLKAVSSVQQQIVLIEDNDEEEKFDFLMNWVRQIDPHDKVIVFCSKKARADYISSELVNQGIECQALHGDREQQDREQAVNDIAEGNVQILVATDLASRGLDIQDLTYVFNYDFPRHIEEYVHRVGRTGRAGKQGSALSLVTRSDWAQAQELSRILTEAGQYVPEGLEHMARRYAAWKEKKEAEKAGGRGRGQFRVKPSY